MTKFKYAFFIIISIALFFASACTTEKNTATTRAYHNVTAKYNVYFNGNEAYQRGLARIQSQHSENYNFILPIFPESNEDAAGVASSDMDRAINKASKTITLHSITARPERREGVFGSRDPEFYEKNEYCKWIDDSYLLMGKAYLIKREFVEARQNFEYLIRQFPNEDTKYEAYIYLARTFIEQENYSGAREILDMLNAEEEFPEDLIKKLNLVFADFHIRQNQYENAILRLNKAIDEIRWHRRKVRYYFILAQLYQELEQLDNAYTYFEKATKRNSDYEMEFNAKVNMANVFIGEGGDARDIQRTLRRMLRDDKNSDFKDQIYYAIAKIYYRAGEIDKATDNFKNSSAVSITNDFQKAMSCLKLGEIYFDKNDFLKSSTYYDSCMMVLPREYEDYSEVRQKARSVSELARYINTVEFQDSVQMVALMSEAERNTLIDGLIAEVIEREKQEREQQRQDQINSMLFDERRGGGQRGQQPIASGGQWYMYDPSQLSYGQNQFRQNWGRRQNEDHWRRDNKASVDDLYADFEEDSIDVEDGQEPRVSNERSRDYYLQDLPLNDSLLQVSHDKILEALFSKAKLYQERFGNNKMAIKTYEELNARYPENEYLLVSYYNLYVLNSMKNRQNEMQKYKSLVTSKFPDSHYANILLNPNYLQEMEEERRRNEQIYADTYYSFRERRCDVVQQNANKYIENNPEGELVSKFDYLKTLCIGKTGTKQDFQMALVEFMQKYPEDELYLAAQEILQFFGTADIDKLIAELKARPPADAKDKKEDDIPGVKSPEEIFGVDEMKQHLYVIKINAQNIDDRRLSFEVRNFNAFNFSMRTFDVSVRNFDDENKLIVVRNFDNKRQVVNYRNMINNNREVFGNLNSNDYEVFLISEENFEILNNNKKIDEYLEFYAANY